MQFLVQLRLVDAARPLTPQEGVELIELVLPTLEACRKLQRDGTILGGGPISGTVGLCLLVQADSTQRLDDVLTSLPVWPRMQTEVIPLSTFDERERAVRQKLDSLKREVR
jgi:muconolactone delta-isomerase